MGNEIQKICGCNHEIVVENGKTKVEFADVEIIEEKEFCQNQTERNEIHNSNSINEIPYSEQETEVKKSKSRRTSSFRYKDSSEYIGEMENGLRHGNGKYISHLEGFTYDGSWVDDLYHGRGVLTYLNKQRFEGLFVKGMKEGFGKLISHDEKVLFEGNFKNDKKFGIGQEYFPDGSSYLGEYKFDKKDGKGNYNLGDGSVYNGEFVEDKICGKGNFKWYDGTHYSGEWRNNAIHGLGVLTKPGKVYKGYFENDKKQGLGMYFYNEDNYLAGTFKRNKIEGLAIIFLNDNEQLVMMEKNKVKEKITNSLEIMSITKSDKYIVIKEFIAMIRKMNI